MELRYHTTARDYLALLNHILAGSIFGRRFTRFAWIGISSLAWLSVLLPYLKFREMGAGFWIRAALAVIVTVGFPKFYSAYSTGCFAGVINARTAVRLAGPCVLTVEAEFAQVATQTTTARAPWRDVHEVVITGTHLFLFFTPLVAAPIPLSAFADEAEFRALHTKMQERWNSAREPA